MRGDPLLALVVRLPVQAVVPGLLRRIARSTHRR
jgi:hypothetical protein